MSDPEFDIEWENDVLSAALRDESFLKSALRVCDSHHFGTIQHAWIWKVTADTWNKYREKCNGKIIAARARDEFPDADKRKPYVQLALKLLKKKPETPKSALEQLTKFVRTVNLQLALENSADHLEKGAIDEAEQAISVASRNSVAPREYTHIRWIEEFEERQGARKYEHDHPDEFTVIPTGIKRLDKALGGGCRIGEIGLILGSTGRGKSVLMTNFVHAGVSRMFPGCYFALEMPARQVATRHDARWSKFEYNKFKTFGFNPAELRELNTRYKRSMKRFANMFHILSMPVRTADIKKLRAALNDLAEEYDFRPKIIGIDSGDHMRSTDRTLDQFRLQQADVYWQLKALAEEDGYVIWSTVQAGKEWAFQIATSEATSESYDKARIADLIVSINDPNARPGRKRKAVISTDADDEDEPEEVDEYAYGKKSQKLELYLAKYRDGESKVKIDLDADLSRMLIREERNEGEDVE